MNYDNTNIPSVYDAGRAYSPEVLARWLDVTADSVCKDEVGKILDLGCGTGRFSAPLALRFKADVIAVDPSEQMLKLARQKPSMRVSYTCAAGEALPFCDACIDLAFLSMVFHHFDEPAQAVKEIRRVLRPGGFVCLRTAMTDRICNYPYVPFFARSGAILNSLLQSQGFIISTLLAEGFRLDRHQIVANEVAPNWPAYAEKLAHRAIAALQELSQQEFEEGLTVLRHFAATAPQAKPVIEPIDFFVFRSA